MINKMEQYERVKEHTYTEFELIDFCNYVLLKRDPDGFIGAVNDAELSNWKVNLIKMRRDKKLTDLGI